MIGVALTFVAAGLLLLPGPAAAAGLPTTAEQVLFVGDSVTAGMYFFAHCDEYAKQGWAGQVMQSLGLSPDLPRLEHPFPLDHLALTRQGFGLAGWRYPWSAVPALRGRRSLFAPDEARRIIAVPGQTLGEVLRQSSEHGTRASTGWVLGAFLLAPGRTALETAESAAREPEWVVLFLGGNDALSFFRMVGAARPPNPGDFAEDYEVAVTRLLARMHAGAPPSQLLVGTIPNVTTLPFLQPAPDGAVDDRGDPLPAGTMTSAFLLPFRHDRFEAEEVWTPDEVDRIRTLVARYNAAIREIAARHGCTVADIAGLTDELAEDAAFATPSSPYLSPDLHHPSRYTHARIAELIVETMSGLAGADPPPVVESTTARLPHAGDLTAAERRRANVLMRLALLSASSGHFPPRPSARLGLELAVGIGRGRHGDASVGIQGQVESSPGPVTSRWVSRGFVGARMAAVLMAAESSEGDPPRLPEEARELRAGVAFEPVGKWSWRRLEGGLRYGWSGGLSWFARGEWRGAYGEIGGDPIEPARAELGVAIGGAWGRPGHNGN